MGINLTLPLANLYAVTGELRYAERAVWILDRFARVYPNYLFHSYNGIYADCPPSEAALELGRHPRAGRFPKEVIINAIVRLEEQEPPSQSGPLEEPTQ